MVTAGTPLAREATLTTDAPMVRGLVYSESTGSLAYIDGSPNLTLVEYPGSGVGLEAGPEVGVNNRAIPEPTAFQPSSTAAGLTAVVALPGDQLAWADRDGMVGTFDIRLERVRLADSRLDPITTLTVSPDGRTLAAGTLTTVALLAIDPFSVTVTDSLATGPGVTRLAFSPDGELLAVGGMRSSIDVYNTTDRTLTGTFDIPGDWVTTLYSYMNGPTACLVVGTSDGQLRIHRLPDLELAGTYQLTAWANGLGTRPDPDGLMAVWQQDGNLTLLDISDVQNITLEQSLPHSGALYALASLSGGRGLVAGGYGGNLSHWSEDSDRDGLVDIVDPFPKDGTQWIDSDGDGYGNNRSGHSPDAFPADPAASLDSDRDGHPDRWNSGRSARHSTTGLSLDRFPHDPTEWADSDRDGVGDNHDPAPDLALIRYPWQLDLLKLAGLQLFGLALMNLKLNLQGRRKVRSLQHLIDPVENSPVALAIPEARITLDRVRTLLGQGRSFAAGRLLRVLDSEQRIQHDHYRQARAEIQAAREDMNQYGIRPPEAAPTLEQAGQAIDRGDFDQGHRMARDLRLKVKETHLEQMARAKTANAVNAVNAAKTAKKPGMTTPKPRPMTTPKPGSRNGPVEFEPVPETRSPRIINISLKDCIINRSNLNLLGDEDAGQ